LTPAEKIGKQMTYPNFKNKHMENALFSPKEFVTWKKNHPEGPPNKPSKFIFAYYPYVINYFRRKYKPIKHEQNWLITIYQYNDMAVVQMTGIGAPNAVVVLEELIALGGREFINVGAAGGLNDFGVFLCDRAIRDEGTSHHYVAPGKYSYPDKGLTNDLGESMKKLGFEFERGTTWTIDAPYRETIKEIQHYRSQGVKAVDMEASALFAVASVRKIKMASAFVVSDILGEDKWDPQFDAKHVRQKLKLLLDAAVDCFCG
jgi:uridine phosphorylase